MWVADDSVIQLHHLLVTFYSSMEMAAIIAMDRVSVHLNEFCVRIVFLLPLQIQLSVWIVRRRLLRILLLIIIFYVLYSQCIFFVYMLLFDRFLRLVIVVYVVIFTTACAFSISTSGCRCVIGRSVLDWFRPFIR